MKLETGKKLVKIAEIDGYAPEKQKKELIEDLISMGYFVNDKNILMEKEEKKEVKKP